MENKKKKGEMTRLVLMALALFIAVPASAHTRCAPGSHYVAAHYYTKDGQSIWAKGRCVRN